MTTSQNDNGQESRIVDVRFIPPRDRHPIIFEAFDSLTPGQTLILVNDHEPRPLYYQFLHERNDQFEWTYLEEGSEVWRAKIVKTVAP